MFERFTERARQVVVLAQEEARTLQHNYVGTEHILLGLLREEEGIAARALEALEITVGRVREEVIRIVGWGEEVESEQIPFTPRAKKVLELSLRESQSLGHNHIGTEHILLGLIREREGVAARILLDFDADPEAVRNEVIRMLSGPGGRLPRVVIRGGLLDPSWLGELQPVLEPLADDIRETLGRTPDSGDLLLALACARDTLAGRALVELGVDLDALWGTIERARAELLTAIGELEHQAEEAREAKEGAIEAQDFKEAARLRDQERDFIMRRRGLGETGVEVLDEMRRRLGLPSPRGPQESL